MKKIRLLALFLIGFGMSVKISAQNDLDVDITSSLCGFAINYTTDDGTNTCTTTGSSNFIGSGVSTTFTGGYPGSDFVYLALNRRCANCNR